MLSFKEFITMQEGLWLADQNAKPGMSRINTTQYTNAEREKMHPTPPKLKAILVKKDPSLQIPANRKPPSAIIKAVQSLGGVRTGVGSSSPHR